VENKRPSSRVCVFVSYRATVIGGACSRSCRPMTTTLSFVQSRSRIGSLVSTGAGAAYRPILGPTPSMVCIVGYFSDLDQSVMK